jgi:tRNA U34 5-methylaminomethyl-2-thiouridine-forming methyltransferase MnmC
LCKAPQFTIKVASLRFQLFCLLNLVRNIQLTEDGSHTISIPALNVTYHSKYGAIQESNHVFIKEGLQYFLNMNMLSKDEPVKIFEAGFGTGLNALLSLNEAIHLDKKINYCTVEPFPLSAEEVNKLNYTSLIDKDLQEYFLRSHACEWGKEVCIQPLFVFEKLKVQLQDFCTGKKFHLIYFDAFDPNAQPEMWTAAIFKKMFDMLYANGILVTYCSKGIVRRTMQAAGFSVEKLKGPPHKREMVRAVKN